MKIYTIILFFFSLHFLLVSCQKNRTIPETETDELEQIVQEDEIIEIEDLEQTVTQLSDGWRPEIPTRERIALPFIEAVTRGDRNEIIKFFHYPILRPFPLPQIENEKEMLEKFDMILTDEVLSDIANSSNDEWQSQAWRGVSFYNGRTQLWMGYDGTIDRFPVFSHEEELVREFWKKDREHLLPEFRQYDGCVGLFVSPTYIVRLDYFIVDPDMYINSYRALFWERNNSKTMSDMPDIILTDGKVKFGGSNPQGVFYFIDNDKVYAILEPHEYVRDTGELFIGVFTEDFDPYVYDFQVPILAEKLVWLE